MERIVGAPVPQSVEKVVPAWANTIAPAVSHEASASSSAPTPSERVMLRRQAQEAAADRAAAELLAEEAGATAAAKKAKKGKDTANKLWTVCGMDDCAATAFLVRDVLRARIVRGDPGRFVSTLRDATLV